MTQFSPAAQLPGFCYLKQAIPFPGGRNTSGGEFSLNFKQFTAKVVKILVNLHSEAASGDDPGYPDT
ncbi:hypothetical protein [Leisingera sp. M523]|uniref:hypothetical protein n=1 Tax=Leisingera sp. M523 TaxID=2867013 RepID=UPI0021A68254|nr:hypothetical protein [Leisingera sp. M523]UWQ27265.1 hypothetical protein K3557_10510 [Leisingera sp. M523]